MELAQNLESIVVIVRGLIILCAALCGIIIIYVVITYLCQATKGKSVKKFFTRALSILTIVNVILEFIKLIS